jgi:flagellar motor switch protein FliN/FliY
LETSAPTLTQSPAASPFSQPVVRSVEFSPIDAGPATGLKNGVDLILDVQLQVSVELGRTSMKVKDVLGLGPGSIVELDKHAGEPVEVVVNNKTVARGEVVVIDENFGVRITEIIHSQRSADVQRKAA